MQVVFTVQAEQDLEEIGDYIVIDNPSRAVPFVRGSENRTRSSEPFVSYSNAAEAISLSA
jgi:plasmid stabilization system protein ParE